MHFVFSRYKIRARLHIYTNSAEFNLFKKSFSYFAFISFWELRDLFLEPT